MSQYRIRNGFWNNWTKNYEQEYRHAFESLSPALQEKLLSASLPLTVEEGRELYEAGGWTVAAYESPESENPILQPGQEFRDWLAAQELFQA